MAAGKRVNIEHVQNSAIRKGQTPSLNALAFANFACG